METQKKTYDLFDQNKPVTSVRLPQLDPRQPGDSNRMEGKNVNTIPGIAKSESHMSNFSGARSRDNSNLAKTASTGAYLSESIKVKIPRLTHELRPEPSPSSTSYPSLAASLLHRKPSHPEISGSGNPSRLTKRVRKNASTKPGRISLQLTGPLKTKTTAAVSGSSKDRKFAKRQGAVSVGPRSQTDRGKRVPVRASTKLSRDHQKQEASTNENGSKGGASEMRSSLTSPHLHRPSPLPSSPKVSHHHTTLTSSPQKWIDYANHTSNADHQGTPIRSSVSHRGRMSQRASSSYRPRGTTQRQYAGAATRPYNDWTTWVEVSIILFGLTPDVSTHDLWNSFNKEGNITTIDIFENLSGSRTGKAKIRFSPPPARAFWHNDSYRVSSAEGPCYVRMDLDSKQRTFKTPSPVNPKKVYDEVMTLNAGSIDFGIMYDPVTMMNMFTAVASPTKMIKFRQNMRRREIVVEFALDMSDSCPPGTRSQTSEQHRIENIRFSIPFRQLEEIHQVDADQDTVVLVLALDQPPQFFRKVDEIYTHEDTGSSWKENDAWYRQTDIAQDLQSLQSSPVTLRKFKPVIDIGRWTTYRFTLDMRRNDRQVFDEMCQALQDHNIRITPFPRFKLIRDREPAVWEFIDKPLVVHTRPKNALEELKEDIVPPLTFPVRFQLEVCISQGVLNEHNLTQEFVTRLMSMDQAKAQDVLEYIANQKKRLFDPMEIFTMKVTRGSASKKNIPKYCAYIRSATVTPSTVYYNTPTVETSNRVLRQYSEHADRFLRVKFADEKFRGRVHATDKDTMNEVFTRIKRTMVNGITIGDRHYEFLAFGNSQFREHGAYFFAPVPYLTARRIRQWMGDFTEIQEVAKHAARLGQCFSTTRAISCARAIIKPIKDIQRNGYEFSDGVGKISPFLAQLTASELRLVMPEPPSVLQFRLGGCKGVLAVWPDVPSSEIHVRETQEKFAAIHCGLEIVRWSQMASANLNRQLILVLSTLGVSDNVFMGKLKLQLANLGKAMTEEKAALALLQKDIDPNQVTLTLAGMILDGFQKTSEPFLVSLLHLWRAWSIKALKEKARILIGDGALLLGCIDESGMLKGHYNGVNINKAKTLQEKESMLPEVFVQLSKGPNGKPYVVKGPMLLARNPSLHPGDIRVVRGVDILALHHLKDAVVLPQTGDRDISSMCAGGDLDGDDYVVMWDKDLLPAEWNHEPMDYTAPKRQKLGRDVTIDDITSFFVNYMKNDALGSIAHAHIAQADWSDKGVKDEKCLELASLHSTAVDYVKSGVPAILRRELRPRKWPHFMEKDKPKDQTYDSKKVLGQLYDHIERVDFVPAFDMPFDPRILHAYTLDGVTIEKATELKLEYDAAIRRIMAQYEINTEFEVWSVFVLQHSKVMRDFPLHEEVGRHSQALKDEFRAECHKLAGGTDFQVLAPFVAAMYHVTNDEMQLALSECRTMVNVEGVETPKRKMASSSMPLMSFPWLFPRVLGQIANGNPSGEHEDTSIAVQEESKRPVPQMKVPKTIDEDMLLETAEGIVHRGEKLALFDHPDEHSCNLDEQPANEATPFEAPPPTTSTSVANSITSSALDLSDSSTLSPNASRLDQLFRREEQDVGTLSKILTPSNSEPGSPKRDEKLHESKLSSTRSLLDEENSGSNAGDEWEGSEDEDGSSDGSVEVHIIQKGPSYLDRLTRLNES